MIIESKRVIYSVEAGLPQLLAYLMANPHQNQPNYGMLTNGSEFLFVKLSRSVKLITQLSKDL